MVTNSLEIELKNITKNYGRKKVLDDINYTFKINNCYMIVGANGSGKSTLIKIILDLVRPSFGYVMKGDLSIGYVPEKYNLAEFLNVETFLMMMGSLRCKEEEFLKKRIDYLLSFWEIEEARKKKLSQLSKGMVQKVILIQAMIHDPDVYILDEALNGLDIKMQERLINYIGKEKKKGKIIIITSHYPKLYENAIDIYLEIKDGKLQEAKFN